MEKEWVGISSVDPKKRAEGGKGGSLANPSEESVRTGKY